MTPFQGNIWTGTGQKKPAITVSARNIGILTVAPEFATTPVRVALLKTRCRGSLAALRILFHVE